jgi:hypothetical protein
MCGMDPDQHIVLLPSAHSEEVNVALARNGMSAVLEITNGCSSIVTGAVSVECMSRSSFTRRQIY